MIHKCETYYTKSEYATQNKVKIVNTASKLNEAIHCKSLRLHIIRTVDSNE
jgi:hypothetical protein